MDSGRTFRDLLALFRLALLDFSRNNGQYMAAGIAYWALFSLFPLALAGLAIAGYVYPSAAGQRDLASGVLKLLPVSESYITGMVSDIARARGTLGLLSILGLLWSGTAVFSAVRKGVNHAWHISEPPYFLLERAVDLLMLGALAIAVFLGFAFTTNMGSASAMTSIMAPMMASPAARVSSGLLALPAAWGVFAVLYHYLPNAKVRWRDVWLGALVGAISFQGIQVGISFSLAMTASLNLVYGSLSGLIAVMLWAYFSSMALVFGAELCYIQSRLWGSYQGEGLPPVLAAAMEKSPTSGPPGIGMVLRWLLPQRKVHRPRD